MTLGHILTRRSRPAVRQHTCDGRVDVQDGFLLTQDGRPLVDDPQRHGLLHAALLGQVGLQQVNAGLPLAVEHFLHCEAVTQREGDGWGQSTCTG